MDVHISGLLLGGAILGILGALLYLGSLELSRFTGGKLLKLEEIDEHLAERLNAWMPLPERWRVSARLMLFIVETVFVALVTIAVTAIPETVMRWRIGLIYILGLLLSFVVVELLVPSMSLRKTAHVLCFFIPLFRICSWLLWPIVALTTSMSEHVREKVEERGEENADTSAEDEIMSLVSQVEPGEEQIEEDERRMITGALELDNIAVHEIMTPRVDIDAIEQTATVEEITDIIVKSGHSRIPVYEGSIDCVKGVIYAKDLLNPEKVATANAEGLLGVCRKPLFVPESKNSGDLLAEFQAKKNHFAVVIDEYGGTAGIVTFEDILEEVVGEIYDEYDTTEPEQESPVEQDGWFECEARMPISDVNEKLGTDIPEDDDFDTIGGYLSSSAGHIPQEKEVVVTEEVEAVIVSAEPRRVKRLRVRKATPADDDSDESKNR